MDKLAVILVYGALSLGTFEDRLDGNIHLRPGRIAVAEAYDAQLPAQTARAYRNATLCRAEHRLCRGAQRRKQHPLLHVIGQLVHNAFGFDVTVNFQCQHRFSCI